MFAQDIIYRNNGDDIEAIVVIVGTDYVHYKRFDNQNGPTYRIVIPQKPLFIIEV